MNNLPYVFIHPMLGPDDGWAAFLAELPSGTRSPELLSQLAHSPQFEEFNPRLPWFFPAESNCSSLQEKGERAVIVFSANAAPDKQEALAPLESLLRKASRKLALAASPAIKLPASGTWDYLLIDASHARSLPPYNLLGIASRTMIGITGLHTPNDREWSQANACSFSTGEYLLARSMTQGKADMTKLKLLKLLSLIEGDANTSDLEDIFREESKLSYSLLRLVNSAAMSPRSPITSFGQAINLLGRRQLQRWLQLLVYSDPNNGQHPTPLLPKAAARGRLIELLCSRLPLDPALEHPEDMAFMIGTFSLLDVLLNMPMSDILNQLPLPEPARQALGDHSGPFGELLCAICAGDQRDLGTAAAKLDALGISPEIHLDAQLTATSWAAKIHPTN